MLQKSAEKASVKEITIPNEVTDPALGFATPASQCHTCGAKYYITCEVGDVRCKHLHGSYSVVDYLQDNVI
nr:DNA-directed RNA polymerase IV subunit 1 isoform X1 [Tanacetum cinerariifolium]